MKSIKFANNIIFQKGKEDEKLQGMGTTAVACFFKESHLYIGNVGDSRAYLIQNDRLYQLTVDHSLVHEKLSYQFYQDLVTMTEKKRKPTLKKMSSFAPSDLKKI